MSFATVGVEDLAGNVAMATASDFIEGDFTLDTSADLEEVFTVSVAADDVVTNLAESTDVSLSLSGIDADASGVSVEITDGVDTVTADASYSEGGWVVADHLSGFADGTLTVTASVTDVAGNSADAVSASLTLDTVADLGGDLNGVFVDGADSVVNADEAAEGAIFVSGFSAPDLQSVAATVTDGSGGLTVTASLGDILNNIPPSVAVTVVGYEGDHVRSAGLTPEAVGLDVTVAQTMNASGFHTRGRLHRRLI